VGPKAVKAIAARLEQLEQAVVDYLTEQVDQSGRDEVSQQLWSDEPAPLPEPYALVLRLRLYRRDGSLPFVEAGGYLDQPYLLSQQIEACLRAEKTVRANRAAQAPATPRIDDLLNQASDLEGLV
jgi:hypothetical protein